jgi:predicted RNase H-like HicB family nuclease
VFEEHEAPIELETLEQYLAVPYVLSVGAVEGPDGDWLCHVEYEELPGCAAEAESPFDALDELDRLRVRFIVEHMEQGLAIPVPRPPLRI